MHRELPVDHVLRAADICGTLGATTEVAPNVTELEEELEKVRAWHKRVKSNNND
jgi:hypothetical protein